MMDARIETILQGESETVEFKKSTSLVKEAIQTLCAFANHHGGYVVFGIDDHGRVLGQQVSDDTLKNIANEVKLNTDPKLYPSIETIEIQGKTCVLVAIEESPLKPHFAYGRPYRRVGTVNQQIDRDMYEYLLQQRFNGYGFDHQLCQGAALKDLDPDIITYFLETANTVRNLNEQIFLPHNILLEKLDLSREGQLTNAAVLLFGRNPMHFFLQHYETKCGLFPSDEGYDEILDDREWRSNLLLMFLDVFGYMTEHIHKQTRKNAVYRTEEYEFPLTAIRECIVNMLVHRDFRQNIKNTIEIRPAAITFMNPAHLFAPAITIDLLKKPHVSRPGNKLIAKIFHLMGLFESWGSGTLKIVTGIRHAGNPEPQFDFANGLFRVILPRKEA
ncbi:hypothetical protein U27_06734 [Candidatus Vecturithrix granuli]|uniref:Schlafen AlbA-2 domain-containing protein n=1 Tax=Vecturithrix granuli TaxID=1499967 RepID=A0A081C594_VECG1|nr:hypothetical protein U27_06734 [Candidatus Vecturithrix granuli]